MNDLLLSLMAIIGGVLTGGIGFILVGVVLALLIMPYIGFFRHSHRPQLKRRASPEESDLPQAH